MDLSRLRYFVTVAEDLHFRKAADKLYVTQSAVSRQITALERELGTVLFKRSRHQVQITEAGRVFLVEAQRILAQADEAMGRARAAGRGEAGTLNVGVVEVASTDIVFNFLRRFQSEHPGVELILSEETSRSATDGIVNRRLHAAFVSLPIVEGDEPPAYTMLKVFHGPMMLAIPENHRLAYVEAICLADLQHENLVLISRKAEPALHDYHMSACTSAGVSPKIVHEVGSTSIAMSYVAAGLGVAFVPPSFHLAPNGSVAIRAVQEAGPEFRIGLMCHVGCPTPTMVSFLNVYSKVFSSESGGQDLNGLMCGHHHHHAQKGRVPTRLVESSSSP